MTTDIIDMDEAGNVLPEREPNRGGRPPGSKTNPFKTKKFAGFVSDLLERNQANIERWLGEVADGKPTRVIEADFANGIPGGVIPGLDPDPAKALSILATLAEFAEPKQGRMLVANDPENPFMQPVLNVTIGGKKLDVTQGNTAPEEDK